MRVLAGLVATLSIVVCAACSAPAETNATVDTSLESSFDRSTLIIVADDGERHEFDVYLATDFEQQRRGLMFVRQMPANVGMLFIYQETDMHSMWMKNTFIPLDMIFARADGSVSSVIHDTQPLSLQSQASTEPVNYVLELNAGTARRLQIGSKSRLIIDPAVAVAGH